MSTSELNLAWNNFLLSTKTFFSSILTNIIFIAQVLVSQWALFLTLAILYFSSMIILRYGPLAISQSEFILRCQIYPDSNTTVLPLLKTVRDVYDKTTCWSNSFTFFIKLVSLKFVLKEVKECALKVSKEAGILKLINDIATVLSVFQSKVVTFIFENPFIHTFPFYSIFPTVSLALDTAYDTLWCLCEILGPFWKFLYYSFKNNHLFCFLHSIINTVLSLIQNVLITIYNFTLTIITSFFTGSSIQQVFVYIWSLQTEFYNTWYVVIENLRVSTTHLGNYIFDVLETFVCIIVSEVEEGTNSDTAVDLRFNQCKNSGDAFTIDLPCIMGSLGTMSAKFLQLLVLFTLNFAKLFESTILGGDFLWKEVNFDIFFDSVRMPLKLNPTNLTFRDYWTEKSSISTLDINYEYNLYTYFTTELSNNPHTLSANPPQLFDYIPISGNGSLDSCSNPQILFDPTTYIKNGIITVNSTDIGGSNIETYNYPLKLFPNATICIECQKQNRLNYNFSSFEGCLCHGISISADNLIEQAIGVRFVKLILCDIIFQLIRIFVSIIKLIVNIIQKFTFVAPYKIIEPLAHRLTYDRVIDEIVGPKDHLGGLLLIPDSIIAHFTLPIRGNLTERTICFFRVFTYFLKGLAESIRKILIYGIQSFFADVVSLYSPFPEPPPNGHLFSHFCLTGPNCIRMNDDILKWFRQPRNEELFFADFVPFTPPLIYSSNIPLEYDSYFFKEIYNIKPVYNGGMLECFCAIINLEFLNDFIIYLPNDFVGFLNNVPDLCCVPKGIGRIIFGFVEFIFGLILALTQTLSEFVTTIPTRIYILEHIACIRNTSSVSLDGSDYQCSNINALLNEVVSVLGCGCVTIGDLLEIDEISNQLGAVDPLICLCTLFKSISGIIINLLTAFKDFGRAALGVLSCIDANTGTFEATPECTQLLPLIVVDIIDLTSYTVHLLGQTFQSLTCVGSSFFAYNCLNDPIEATGPACASITFETCVIFKKECYNYFPSDDIGIKIPTTTQVNECISQCNDITGGTCVFCRDLVAATNYVGNTYVGCPYGCVNSPCRPTDKLPAFIKSIYDVIGNLLRLILDLVSDFIVYAIQTSSGGTPPPVGFPITITGYVNLILDSLGESLFGNASGNIWGVLQYFGDMLNCLIGPPGCVPVISNDPPVGSPPPGKVFCFGNLFILLGNVLAETFDAFVNFLISFMDIIESILTGNFGDLGTKIKTFIISFFDLLEVFFNNLDGIARLIIGFVAGLIDVIFGGGYDIIYDALTFVLDIFLSIYNAVITVVNFIRNLFGIKKRFFENDGDWWLKNDEFVSFLNKERTKSSFANSLFDLIQKFTAGGGKRDTLKNLILKRSSLDNFDTSFMETYNITEEEYSIIKQPHTLLPLVTNDTYCYKVLYNLQNVTSFQDMSLFDELAFKTCYSLVLIPIMNNANSENIKIPLDITYNIDRMATLTKESLKIRQLGKSWNSMFHQISQLWINNNVDFNTSGGEEHQEALKKKRNLDVQLKEGKGYIFNPLLSFEQSSFDNGYILDTSNYNQFSNLLQEEHLKGYYDEKDAMKYKNFTHLDVLRSIQLKNEKFKQKEYTIKNFFKYGNALSTFFQEKNLNSYEKMVESPYLKTYYTNYYNYSEVIDMIQSISPSTTDSSHLKRQQQDDEKYHRDDEIDKPREKLGNILDKKSLQKIKYLVFILRRIKPKESKFTTSSSSSRSPSRVEVQHNLKTMILKQRLIGIGMNKIEENKEEEEEEEEPKITFQYIRNNFIRQRRHNEKRKGQEKVINYNQLSLQSYHIYQHTIPQTFKFYLEYFGKTLKRGGGGEEGIGKGPKRTIVPNDEINNIGFIFLKRYFERGTLIYNSTQLMYNYTREKFSEKLKTPLINAISKLKRSKLSAFERQRLTLPEKIIKIAENFNRIISKKEHLFSNVSNWKIPVSSELTRLVKQTFLNDQEEENIDDEFTMNRLVEFSCSDCNCSILEDFIQEFLDIVTYCYEKQFLNNSNPENTTIIYKVPTIEIVSINNTESFDFITNFINDLCGFDIFSTIEKFITNINIHYETGHVGLYYFLITFIPLPWGNPLPCKRINLSCQLGLGFEQGLILTLLILFILLIALNIVLPPLSNFINFTIIIGFYTSILIFGVFLLAGIAWGYQYNCYYTGSGSSSLITYLVPFLSPGTFYPECAADEIFTFVENYIINPCPFTMGGLFDKIGINIEPLFISPANLMGYCARNNVTGLLESSFGCNQRIDVISCYDYGLKSPFSIMGLFILKYLPSLGQGLIDSCLVRGSCFNFLIGSTTYPGTNEGILNFLFTGVNITAFQQGTDPILKTCLDLNILSAIVLIPIILILGLVSLIGISILMDFIVWIYAIIRLTFGFLNPTVDFQTYFTPPSSSFD